MSRAELKQEAKNQLRGNWLWAEALSLVASIIIYIAQDIVNYAQTGRDRVYDVIYKSIHDTFYYTYVQNPFSTWGWNLLSIILSLFIGMILWSVAYTILKFRDSGETPNIFKGMFSAFTAGKFLSTLLTYLLYEIFLMLWYILLVIPGIVKYYSYSMTPYIMKDLYDSGKTPTATEAITKSRELMDGHKTDLFVLDLSFLGWAILGIVTAGIGFIWITPYYRQTKANFYRKLAGDKFLK